MKAIMSVIVVAAMVFTATANAYEPLPEYRVIKFSGDGMADTILNGDIIVCDMDGEFGRGDIVLYTRNESVYVGRVVAISGDRVYRANAVTHVVYDGTDEALDARYEAYFPNGHDDDYPEYTIADGECFIVGDNRYNSKDSREWMNSNLVDDIGPIQNESVLGVVIGKGK